VRTKKEIDIKIKGLSLVWDEDEEKKEGK